ncbi:MAG TPA: trypsin-like peptidase domain-containing protein [Lachnospiraceae bacterium]|nr:trypsin-like peptidase domain-containing protein [Lachnospiraceae bacterium]
MDENFNSGNTPNADGTLGSNAGSSDYGNSDSGASNAGYDWYTADASGAANTANTANSANPVNSYTAKSGYDPNGTEDERQAFGNSSNAYGGNANTSYSGNSNNVYGGTGNTTYTGGSNSSYGGNGSAPYCGNGSASYGGSGSAPYSGSGNASYGGNNNYSSGQSFSNNGYGSGNSGYTSSYDAYRFQTPLDPSPIDAQQMNYSDGNTGTSGKTKAPKKNTIGKKIGLIAGLAALFGLVAALVFFGVNVLTGRVTGSSSQNGGTITPAPTPTVTIGNTSSSADSQSATGKSDTESADDTSGDMTVPQVVAQVMPSMVAITNTSVSDYQNIFGQSQQEQSVSAGSGIIVGETDDELLIATNNHVVQESSEITVAFVDNSAISGTVKGADAQNDLAIVAVNISDISADTLKQIKVVTIGDSTACQVGESVVAIGNALGYGQSVSSGIVSALNREVTVDNVTHSLIQTDASINPGNSGGALLNMKGELIGINEVKYVDTEVEGVGYAIPMATAEPILQELGNKATRQKVSDDQASYIGIKCLDVPSSYVSAGYPAGVYVSDVTSGGPADQAGIVKGDIITAIDGYSVTSSSELINELEYYAAGETIDFTVCSLNSDQTAYVSKTVSVTLGSKAAAGLTDSTSSTDSTAGNAYGNGTQPNQQPNQIPSNGTNGAGGTNG